MLIDPKNERFIDRVLAGMTVEEKVGQLVQADIASVTPEEAQRYHLGSILAGGNAAPGGDIRTGPKAWLDLVDAFQKAALSAPADRHPPIPIIFGIDAVHGDAKVRGATIFPHNVGLGATHDPALLQQIGRATAQEVSATGVDWTFAPTVAVARDVRWGRSYESYADDPALVAQYSAAMVTGVQGRLGSADFLAPGHTLSSVKHFLGDGGTLDGRDQGDNRSSETVLRDVHAAGYPPAIQAGAAIVMASYNGWQGAKMHGNHSLLTDVLKGRMGFNGFVVGDWNAQEEIPGCTKFSCPQAINAGIDMIMAPDSWRQFYDNTLDQVRRGVISESRLDDAVRRILRVKALAGLFDRPSAEARPGAGDFSAFGGAEHRGLARQAVRESLVLLKNQGGLLPLKPQARILVAGAAADDIGQQAGGWTVDWQGAHNTNADLPGATSIWSGIKAAVESAGGSASLSPDGHFTQRPDAAIVVFGERPYAEFVGDRETVEFSPNDKSALVLLRRLKAQKIPVIAVFLSGRPLWVNPELNAADAFVAAWLPGSEGEGVADVLFRRPDGQVDHDFKGRLSFNWPATGMPVRYPQSKQPTGVLFPRGYGLDYESHHAMAHLSEDAKVPPERRARDTFFHAGHVTAPWSIYVADPDAEVRLTMIDQPSPDGDLDTRHDGSAIRAAWSGGKPAVWRIGGGGRTVDLAEAAKVGQGLQLSFRVVGAPTGPVTLGQACGAGCAGSVDLTKALSAKTAGWASLTIPLACFAKAGADLSRIEDPVVLKTAGKLDLLIREARLAPASKAVCPGG
ncbi:glycoside hydrolase family 3 protein [Phenylobacterium montanum]|uniref:glycoside hydrolase family 3 protein n=1 Tax=Phenylobacterium montanum TaxID=2823693 RepID=UPI002012565B|nr:glycoside hydrolase family 3 protein [Caulobacter sp. S6]